MALARSESPRGSARNAARSVPLEDAYEAPGSVMFVLYVGSHAPEYRKCGSENFREPSVSRLNAWKEARAGLLAVELGAQRTHKSATRPVDGLIPNQVPSARTSRPESTFPLLFE